MRHDALNVGREFFAQIDFGSAAGVDMTIPLVDFDRDADKATPRCLVLVTPDHDRTFAFNMGICEEIDIPDIDVEALKNSKIFFIEGQMLVSRRARPAVLYAMQTAKKHGVKIAFNMHDLNFRALAVQEVIETIRTQSDILIGNEREVRGCFEIDENSNADSFLEILTSRNQILVHDGFALAVGFGHGRRIAFIVDFYARAETRQNFLSRLARQMLRERGRLAIIERNAHQIILFESRFLRYNTLKFILYHAESANENVFARSVVFFAVGMFFAVFLSRDGHARHARPHRHRL